MNGDCLSDKRTAAEIVLSGYDGHEYQYRREYEYDRFHGFPRGE
jgi:hypothetical protein